MIVAILGSCRGPGSPCEPAIKRANWTEVRAACAGARWAHWRELARAWQAYNDEDVDSAIRWAEPLLTTEVEASAAYLLGYAYGYQDDHKAAAFMERAFRIHRRQGNHTGASKAAVLMAELSKSDFDKRLFWANLAIEEARKSGDPGTHGSALRSLARAYDIIGMADEAITAFVEAENLLIGSPKELAHTYLKHGSFLVDRGSPKDLQAALDYYDDAEAQGPSEDDQFAIWLNRVFALGQLGRLDEAAQTLGRTGVYVAEQVREDKEKLSKLELVAGHLAAHSGDVARASSHFEAAQRLATIDHEHTWEMHLALARAYQRAGRPSEQETALRKAVAVIEALRTKAKSLELRTWIQAHRREPHEELFVLLAAQGRHREALEIADQVVAGTWRDKVLGAKGLSSAHNLPLPASASTAPAGEPTELLFYFSLRDGIIWRAYLQGEALRLEPLPPDTEKILEQLASPDADSQLFERAAAYLLPANLGQGPAPLRIIANGKDLAMVPFAALPWRGRPLIFSRSLVFLPTRQEHPCTPATSAPVLMADSQDNLPAARREVQSLAAQLNVEPDLGSGATLARVGAARGARLLHIATHGKETATGRAMELADGYLTGPKVLELLDGKAPELVVLSGCATAQNLAPEPWDGLPTAFLAAGSRYVIATLRTIPDDQAAQVMHAYYAQPEPLSAVERLAAAQRQLADKLPATVWASFTVWGDNCQPPSSQTAQLAR